MAPSQPPALLSFHNPSPKVSVVNLLLSDTVSSAVSRRPAPHSGEMDYTLCPAAQPFWQAGSSRGPEGLGAPAGTPYRSIHYHSVASLLGEGGSWWN